MIGARSRALHAQLTSKLIHLLPTPTSPRSHHQSYLCLPLLYDNPVSSTPESSPGPQLSVFLCSFHPQMPPYSFAGWKPLPASAHKLGALREGGNRQDPEERGPSLLPEK